MSVAIGIHVSPTPHSAVVSNPGSLLPAVASASVASHEIRRSWLPPTVSICTEPTCGAVALIGQLSMTTPSTSRSSDTDPSTQGTGEKNPIAGP